MGASRHEGDEIESGPGHFVSHCKEEATGVGRGEGKATPRPTLRDGIWEVFLCNQVIQQIDLRNPH